MNENRQTDRQKGKKEFCHVQTLTASRVKR